ncbi:hypothetical protein SLEP1_g13446 [Rubroshorea leprosula]|uniref:Pentatricopeptide repeat-containing protein n=1 Tax=Rubroshorea leprosula TaxID=152421 RepID=A0AAV5ILS9_9ROSI|nr:hypothetical protein SLEP1_g13446 [Rubroshorea leprosula]
MSNNRPPNTQSATTHRLHLSKTIIQLKQTHAFLLKTGTKPQCHLLLTQLLLRLLRFPGDNLSYAHHLFGQLPSCKNQYLWTSLIRSHVIHAQFSLSIRLYSKMQREGVLPSEFTFSSVLNACARIPAILEGKQVHGRVVKSSFFTNRIVQTALLDMYAKCGCLVDAQNLFDVMCDKDVVAWTAMICGYTKVGMMQKAMSLFDCMGERNVVTWTAMVAGYANSGDMKAAKELYDMMWVKNSITWVAMIAGYGKCGDVSEAKRVFDDIVAPDATCWAAMLACYAQNGYAREAIDMYMEMGNENVKITDVAMVGAISACTQLEDVEMAKRLTKNMEKGCCDRTLFLSNAFIHMHAKCGCMDQAWKEFNTMKERDVVSYGAMITALADNGETEEALNLFSKMQKEGIKPNQITFIGALSACSHAGLIEEGCKLFNLMTRVLGIKPLSQHLTCMVVLLGMTGQLKNAYNLIMEYKGVSDAGTWGALLGACKVHGNTQLGEIAASHLFEIEPQSAGNYVVLANTYASLDRWGDAERVRKMIGGRGNRKFPGCSWVSIIK